MVRFRYFSILVGLLFYVSSFAQQATVTAKNYDISDNLDLQAVASVFGDSKDLADFEFRLNDPEMRLSNLDLNRDGYVDYLRVIEAVEGRTHLVVIQAVLGQDVFQDVATIEVEKDRRNQVQIQIVGNSYIYGNNYIYEPYYVHTPSMFSIFWSTGYRPYHSSWYWNYYPTYFNYWQPYPVYTYTNHVHGHINRNNRYVYATNRSSSRAVRMHREVRSNAYERNYPQNSFSSRNNNVSNRHVLQQNRGVESGRVSSSNANSNRVQNSNSNRSVNSISRGESGNYRRGQAVSGSTLESTSRTSSNRTATPASTRSQNTRVQNTNSRENATRSSNFNSNTNSSRVNTSRTNTAPRATNAAPSRVQNTSPQPARIQRTSAPSNNSTSRQSSSVNRSSNSNFSSGRSSAPSSRGASMGSSSRSNSNSGRSSSR